MSRINCSVNNCSHNNQGTCYANRVDVSGMSAHSSNNTCCSSFLDESHYSKLTNNTNDSGECTCLICNAQTCTYNSNNLCNLDSINISSDIGRANLYLETSCSSFESK